MARTVARPDLLPDRIRRVIEGVKWTQHGIEYKLPSRIAATEMAMKNTGMYELDNAQKPIIKVISYADLTDAEIERLGRRDSAQGAEAPDFHPNDPSEKE